MLFEGGSFRLQKPLQGAVSPCRVPVLGCSGLEHGCDAPAV